MDEEVTFGLDDGPGAITVSSLRDAVAEIFPVPVRLSQIGQQWRWPPKGGETLELEYDGARTHYRIVGIQSPDVVFVWPIVLPNEEPLSVLKRALDMAVRARRRNLMGGS